MRARNIPPVDAAGGKYFRNSEFGISGLTEPQKSRGRRSVGNITRLNNTSRRGSWGAKFPEFQNSELHSGKVAYLFLLNLQIMGKYVVITNDNWPEVLPGKFRRLTPYLTR